MLCHLTVVAAAMTDPDDLGEIFSTEKKVTLSTQSSLQQDENLDEWGTTIPWL